MDVQQSEAVAQRCSVKKVFLKNSQNSPENPCASLFFNKVAGLSAATFLKIRLWCRCFPVNFAKFLRKPFFIEHLRWLLLNNLILIHPTGFNDRHVKKILPHEKKQASYSFSSGLKVLLFKRYPRTATENTKTVSRHFSEAATGGVL